MKSPAFQFYPDDYMGGKPGLMRPEETHVYIWLLCLDWNHGAFAFDEVALARWCRVPVRVLRKAWPVVSACFDEVDGLFHNARLEQEREKQREWREKSSNGGKQSAKQRADQRATTVATVVEECLQPNGQPKGNTPFPTPLPTNSLTTKATTPAAARRSRKPIQAGRQYPNYSIPLCLRLHAKWEAAMKVVVPYPAFRKRTAGAFDRPGFGESEAPEVFEETIDVFAAIRDSDRERERKWFTPEQWWGQLPRLIEISKMPYTIGGTMTEKGRIAFGEAA